MEERRVETQWQRFASYSVTVSYSGKTTGPYKALMLLGHDEHGNEQVEAEDSFTDVTGLALALSKSFFPESLVATRLRTYPFVTSWLNTTQMQDQSCSSSQLSMGKRDVCCDLQALKCGIRHMDLVNEMSKPLPSPTLEPRR